MILAYIQLATHGIILAAAILALINSLRNTKKIDKVYLAVNGRIDQLLKMAKEPQE